MTFVLVAIIIVLLYLYIKKDNQKKDFLSIKQSLNDLILKTNAIKKDLENLSVQDFTSQKSKEPIPSVEDVIDETTITEPIVEPINSTVEPEKATDFTHKIEELTEEILAVQETVKPIIEDAGEPKVYSSSTFGIVEDKATFKAEPKATPKPKEPSFFDKNPDLEKFIGENLINKIGIAILVLGIGFFVKFAIDQNWINEIGRVLIGVVAGGILIGIAHKLRNTLTSFSSVLVGGGLSVLYFTIAIAFHEYQIFNQTVAFTIMVVITLFAVLLSISYNRMELAILAILGGFGSPFMISTGAGNYQVLFTYILILNIGMLSLSYFKKWNMVNILSYAFTIILYGSWLATKVIDQPDAPYIGAFIFGTIFYIVFFFMNIINNVKEGTKFNAFDISILLSNTFVYYSSGMLILNHIGDGKFMGGFTISIAIYNFIFSYLLYKKERVDTNLVYLLIGVVLTFVSLAAPVQLEGNYITLFWATESVLLLWLSQKSGIKLLRLSSVIVFVLMLISVYMDWSKYYFNSTSELPLMVLLNKAFITGLVVVVATFLNRKLVNNETDDLILNSISVSTYKRFLTLVLIGVTYVILFLEIQYQITLLTNITTAIVVLFGYHLLYCLVVQLIITKIKVGETLQLGIVSLSLLSIAVYLFKGNSFVIELRNLYLTNEGATFVGYMFHYVNAITVSILLIYSLTKLKTNKLIDEQIFTYANWITVFLGVAFLSMELDHIVVMSAFDSTLEIVDAFTVQFHIKDILSQNHKIGYAILWGISSFTIMVLGMKKKNKTLRIISLVLFFITLLKLFIVDIKNISEGGKILAFILLGVLLLIISFMYQKLKNLILDVDENTPETPNSNEE